MKQSFSRRRESDYGVPNRSFTLVEMLVVITVMMILMSLLLPALNQARTMSQQISCVTNLKNISTSEGMYQNDFHGNIVPPFDNNRVFAPHLYTNLYAWHYYFGKTYQSLAIDEWGYPVPWQWSAMRCPLDVERRNSSGNLLSTACSYAALFGWGYSSYGGNFVRAANIKAPSKTIFIAEDDYKQQQSARFRYYSCDGSEVIWGYEDMGLNHNNKTNILFLDGHTQTAFILEGRYSGKDLRQYESSYYLPGQ